MAFLHDSPVTGPPRSRRAGLLGTGSAILREVLELALPRRCAGCSATTSGTSGGGPLCARCLALLGAHRPPRVIEVTPTPVPDGFPRTWAGGPLTPAWSSALTAYKDGDRRDLVAVLAAHLALAIAGARGDPQQPLVIVPVPSSARARRRRGDRPLDALARRAAEQLPGDVAVATALVSTRPVRDQSTLTREQRQGNLTGAFVVRGQGLADLGLSAGGSEGADWAAVRVVLVDDIVTSGATLAEAARALRGVGVEPHAACIVATRRRAGPVPRPMRDRRRTDAGPVPAWRALDQDVARS